MSTLSPVPSQETAPKPDWTQRPAFVKLVDAATRAADAGFDRLCLRCCKGFDGAECPRCDGGVSERAEPDPETFKSAMHEVAMLVEAALFHDVVASKRDPDADPEYIEHLAADLEQRKQNLASRIASLTTCTCGRPKYSRCDVCEAK